MRTTSPQVLEPRISLNYTTALDIVFVLVGAAPVWGFLRAGGRMMLRVMGGITNTGRHLGHEGGPPA